MLVEERPPSGLGHPVASALGVVALVCETRKTSTTELSCARFVLIVSKLLQEPFH
jgi:hypothetical protein